jgi:hypothetical protein
LVSLATAWVCSLAVFSSATTNIISAAENELPSAEELLDEYVEATGGKEAYDSIKNRVTTGTMEIAGQGVKLSITVYAAKPNLAYTIAESDVTGKIESGTDGTVVWEDSLLRGPAIKKGAERSSALRDATFDRLVHWRSVYGKAECVGKQAVDGKMCFEIVLTPKPTADQNADEPLILYIDEKSGLVAEIESNVVTAAGTIPVQAGLSDYRKVDGILIPHKLVTRLLNQERIMTISTVEHNVELPEDRFKLPDQIQALKDKE